MKKLDRKIKPRPGILKVPFYVAGAGSTRNFTDIIKLSSNENPRGPSRQAINAFLSVQKELGTYPDSNHKRLRAAIGQINNIDENRIICGAGSDEIIHFLCQCYAGQGDEVIHTEHAFLMYRIYALAMGATPISVPEIERRAEVSNILKACTKRTKLIFLANPNNPTGTLISSKEIMELVDSIPRHTLLVLDGAYAEYIEDFDPGLKLVDKKSNLFVLRTFSKIHGLASLRVGWGYGSADVVNALMRVKGPFNISSAAQESAIAAILDTDYVKKCRLENIVQRDKLANELKKIGISSDHSFGNFILMRFPNSRIATSVNAFLKENGLIVRNMDNYGLRSALRVTVGTPSDCKTFLDTLKKYKE